MSTGLSSQEKPESAKRGDSCPNRRLSLGLGATGAFLTPQLRQTKENPCLFGFSDEAKPGACGSAFLLTPESQALRVAKT